jgi:hypothetical protein
MPEAGKGKGASFRMRTVREEATSPIGPVEDSSSRSACNPSKPRHKKSGKKNLCI